MSCMRSPSLRLSGLQQRHRARHEAMHTHASNLPPAQCQKFNEIIIPTFAPLAPKLCIMNTQKCHISEGTWYKFAPFASFRRG